LCTCGNDEFAPVYKIKKLSKILSPTAKDEFVQIVELRCTKCQTSLVDLMHEVDNPKASNKSLAFLV